MTSTIRATLYNDPACPWGYSAIPALRALDWRYGDQIDWRLVMIGLSEDASQYAERGFTPLLFARSQLSFRRYGMPFAPEPKERISATGRACRAVVAARLIQPGTEWLVLRTLQLANFTTMLLLDDDAQLAAVLDTVPGLDGAAIVSRLDDSDVAEAYEQDRAEARTAAGSPAELQGKTADSDGPVRFTAPSVIFERDGQRVVAGGFQLIEAYDVVVANLDPQLQREGAPETPELLLRRFPEGLTTQEIALMMTNGNDAVDRVAAEGALLDLVGNGIASRRLLGDDALWQLASSS